MTDYSSGWMENFKSRQDAMRKKRDQRIKCAIIGFGGIILAILIIWAGGLQ